MAKPMTALVQILMDSNDEKAWEKVWAMANRILAVNQGRDRDVEEFVMQVIAEIYDASDGACMNFKLLACPNCGEYYYYSKQLPTYADLVIASPRCEWCEAVKEARYELNLAKSQGLRDRGAANRAAKEENSE